ncbi:MAG: polyphosphate polymerase domain-containing protein [Lactobacillales bacterium]|jgi:SPX domain protein involved in polyphosphate accumulation|nr:polyphosphate polymerase domain-containing protein [Lactobacillales bacterium]
MAKSKVKEGQIFERKEKKYVLTREKFSKLINLFEKHMDFDDYGLHTINTIYYDNSDYDVIRHLVSKPKFKEKLRLRSYGQLGKKGEVFLELKKKVAGITYKRREKLSYEDSQRFLNHEPIAKESQILNEINYYQNQNELQPKVLVSYDRLAMSHRHYPDFRITFDQNIRYSLNEFDLTQVNEIKQQYLIDEDTILMEIKIAGSFPLEISRILSKLNIYQGKFTKYGNIYKEVIEPQYYQNKLDKRLITEEINYDYEYSV